MPVEELKQRIGYNEFLDWIVFLEKAEVEPRVKGEWYLAQIAAEVRRGWVADHSKVKTKDFLIRYETAEDKALKESRADRLKQSKSAWTASVGINLKEKHHGRRKPRSTVR